MHTNSLTSAHAVALSEVASLKHEARNHTVKARALVVQRLAGLASALLPRAQGTEVLHRLGYGVAVESKDDALR
jgi:hypothetical protein